MPQNYDLKINGSIVGTLRAPIFGLSPRPDNTAGFTQTGATVETPLPNFTWTIFTITLKPNLPLPSSVAPGSYTLSQYWRGPMTVEGDMTTMPDPLTPIGDRHWKAVAETTNDPNLWRYTLTIGSMLFGIYEWRAGAQKVQLYRNGILDCETVWESWASFSFDTPGTYGPFRPGRYTFGNGHFTKLGKGEVPDRKKDEPTTWEATAQVVR